MKLLDYIFATRPMLQVPIWTVYLVSLHYHHRLSGQSFDWLNLATMAGISLIFSGAVYINQVFDFDSDLVNQKVGFLQRGLLKERELITVAAPLLFVPLALSGLVSFYLLFVTAQFVLLAYAYSVPPLKLKDRPIPGLLANAYGHGFLVAISVLPNMTVHNAGKLGWDSPFYYFFAVGATYLMTTIPDAKGDKLAGKRTLPVVVGAFATKTIALLLTALSAYIAHYSKQELLVYVSIAAFVLTLVSLFVRRTGFVLATAKIPLLLLSLVACNFYPFYLVFLVALIILTRIYYKRRFGLSYPRLI